MKILARMKYLFCFCAITFFLLPTLHAQNSTEYFERVDKVEAYAKKGTGEADVKSLIKAIKLLIEYPEIRPLNLEKKPKEDDYFNPYSLFELAETYAKRKKHKKTLKKLKKQLEHSQNIRILDSSPESIRVPGVDEYFFQHNEPKDMFYQPKKDQSIRIRFKTGKDISIKVFEATDLNKPIFKDTGKEEIKWIRFDADKGKKYVIRLLNNTGKGALLQLAVYNN